MFVQEERIITSLWQFNMQIILMLLVATDRLFTLSTLTVSTGRKASIWCHCHGTNRSL